MRGGDQIGSAQAESAVKPTHVEEYLRAVETDQVTRLEAVENATRGELPGEPNTQEGKGSEPNGRAA